MTPLEAPLDPGLVKWLADPRTALRAPSATLPLADVRAGADGFLARATGPEMAEVRNLEAAGDRPPLRLYRPNGAAPDAVIVFAHGGGFVMGSLASHDGFCRRLAATSGTAVLAVDYRLAPEHPFPAAIKDVRAVVVWAGATIGRRVALAGDSAGAQIATAAALELSGTDAAPGALGLFYPCLNPDRDTASQAAFAEGRMMTAGFLAFGWASYRGGQAVADDSRFDLRRADLGRLPPVRIVTAGHDPLRDEGLALADQLTASGVPVASRNYPDQIHGFVGLPRGGEAADDAMAFIAEGLFAALISPE